MTRQELNQALAALRDEKQQLQEAKNKNYAQDGDAFANLNLIEKVTNGRITTEQGIFIRALDKVSRLGNLLFDPEVKDEVGESIEDTWKDLSIYAELAFVARREATPEPPPVNELLARDAEPPNTNYLAQLINALRQRQTHEPDERRAA